MDDRYYEILRSSSQEEFYQAINNPEAELYEILWVYSKLQSLSPLKYSTVIFAAKTSSDTVSAKRQFWNFSREFPTLTTEKNPIRTLTTPKQQGFISSWPYNPI